MTSFTRRTRNILLVSALAGCAVPGFAQTSDRLSDKDVKAIIDQVDTGRDKFEGNLDGQFKGSTLRGPAGETKVAGALQDYQDSTKKLQDRFKADYSAGPEVATVLKQSTQIDTFMKGSPDSMKGRSEWDSQVMNLKRLAETYGTTFPTPDGAVVRRMNDKEAAAAAASVGAAAERFKDELDKASTVAKPVRDAAKKDVEALVKQADTVESRINDGKPATAEVRQLLEQTGKVQAFVDANPVPAAMPNWQSVQASLVKLQQAFGLTK
jgi:hypothetical protein